MTPRELRPKDRFLTTTEAASHLETTATKEFQVALEAALAEMVMQQPNPQGLEEACRCHYQLLGARRFIDIFLNLSIPVEQSKARISDNLLWQRQLHSRPLQTPPPSPAPQQPPPVSPVPKVHQAKAGARRGKGK